MRKNRTPEADYLSWTNARFHPLIKTGLIAFSLIMGRFSLDVIIIPVVAVLNGGPNSVNGSGVGARERSDRAR